MLKKLVLALAVVGLIGAAGETASARGYGRGGYCGPHHHHAYGRSYGGYYAYRGPASYFGPSYGYSGDSVYGGYRGYGYGGYRGYGYGGYGYSGYGYGRSGISIGIGY